MSLIGNRSEYREGEEDFESYQERLEQWIVANTEEYFSVINRSRCVQLLKSLLMSDKPRTKSYAQLAKALSDHYKPKTLAIMERFRFHTGNQQESESVSDFVLALKQLSTNCDFGAHLDDAPRDKLVSGLRSEAIQRKLLAESNVTFKSACDTALSIEMASTKLHWNSQEKEKRVQQLIECMNKEKRASSNSHISPATDVEVSTELRCADLSKKNATIAPEWDMLHACVGIRRHRHRGAFVSNRTLKQAWHMETMKTPLGCTQYTQLQMVMMALWLA